MSCRDMSCHVMSCRDKPRNNDKINPTQKERNKNKNKKMAATVMLSLLHASKTFLSRFALLFTLYCCLAFSVLFLSICIVSCMLPCLLVSFKCSLQFYPPWVLCFKPFCRVVTQVFPIC
jgi:hypothetical protein